MLCNTRTQLVPQSFLREFDPSLDDPLDPECVRMWPCTTSKLLETTRVLQNTSENLEGEDTTQSDFKFLDFDSLFAELSDKRKAKENKKLLMKKFFDNRKKPKRVRFIWYMKSIGEPDEKRLPEELIKQLEISLLKKNTFTRHNDPLFPSATVTYDPQKKTVTVSNCLQGLQQTKKLKRKVMVQGIPIKIPEYWEASQQYMCQIFTVRRNSPEFQSIEQTVHETLPNAIISKIERVQNLAVYSKYSAESWYVAEQNKGTVNQKQLFHGTRGVKPGLIVNNMDGFDPRLSGNNNLWGSGAYFATKASYADLYAYKGADNERVIILASVALGSCFDYGTLCNPSLKSPPINTETKRKYDSICGMTRDTCVYAVYNASQAYPRYMITYSLSDGLINADASNYSTYPTFAGSLKNSSSSV